MKSVLTIAGSDCSGGAGIQADLKTFMAFGMYGMSVITAVTAQNTVEVAGIHKVPEEFVARQLDSVFCDIIPDAVKIGMVFDQGIIEIIAKKLKQYNAKHIVVDPVMVATSGGELFQQQAKKSMIDSLFPLAELITPNLEEAEVLAEIDPIMTEEEMESAAKQMSLKYQTAVLVKGGHMPSGKVNDILYSNHKKFWFTGNWSNNPNTHGTGCTLSSAVACGLAQGLSLPESIENGKRYVEGALHSNLQIGKGRGPLNHNWRSVIRQ